MVFFEKWNRFVLVKRFHREFFFVPRVTKALSRQVRQIQATFQGGIALPLSAGVWDGHVFQITEQPPGHSLVSFLRWNGRLPARAVLALMRGIVERLIFVREHYGVQPSLAPEAVVLCEEASGIWAPVFSDYKLRQSGQMPDTTEKEILEDLSILLCYLCTRKIVTSFEVFDAADWGALFHAVPGELIPAVQYLLRHAPGTPPPSLNGLLHLLDESAPTGVLEEVQLVEPKVDSRMLKCLPSSARLASRFVRQRIARDLTDPASFEAHDLLRDEPRRVHLLPPFPNEGPFRGMIDQARRLSRCRTPRWLLPVEDVLCDPSGCVIAERKPEGLPVQAFLEQHPPLRVHDAASLLGRIGRAFLSARLHGWKVPSLAPWDIYVQLDEIGYPNSRGLKVSEVRFRSFPSNVHFGPPSFLADFHSKFSQKERERAVKNWVHPDFSYFVLAAVLLQTTCPGPDQWPNELWTALRQAFLSRASWFSHVRLIAKFETFAGNAFRKAARRRTQAGALAPGGMLFPHPFPDADALSARIDGAPAL